jgi:hypothetical protein
VVKKRRPGLLKNGKKSGKSKREFAMELGLNAQTFTSWTRKGSEGQGFVEFGEKPGPRGEKARTALVAVTETLMYRETVVERGEIRIQLPPQATGGGAGFGRALAGVSHDAGYGKGRGGKHRLALAGITDGQDFRTALA